MFPVLLLFLFQILPAGVPIPSCFGSSGNYNCFLHDLFCKHKPILCIIRANHRPEIVNTLSFPKLQIWNFAIRLELATIEPFMSTFLWQFSFLFLCPLFFLEPCPLLSPSKVSLNFLSCAYHILICLEATILFLVMRFTYTYLLYLLSIL